MKKLITLSFFVCMTAMTANTGCKSGGGTTNPITALPDIANFELQAASAFVKGAASTISILAPNLGSGTFTVNFDLSGNNTLSGQTATLTMNGNTGTFQTPALANSGETNITINSITNSAGGTASISSNNTYNISDSSGLMTWTYTSGGSGTTLRATHVNALITGPQLSIVGIIWQPNTTMVTLNDIVFTGATGIDNFNIDSLPSTGNADYQASSTTTLINDAGQSGAIKITAVSPLLTGTFSFTNMDGSTVVGSFSCPNP